MPTNSYDALNDYMDLLLDAICVVDADGRFIYVSRGSERIFGYTPEEMLGRNMIDLVHPDDRAKTLDTVNQIMAGDHQPHFENRYVRRDGAIAHIMWSARWSEDNKVRVAVARDITLRKQAEAVQAAQYAISEATHNADDLESLCPALHHIIAGLIPSANLFLAVWDASSGALVFPCQAALSKDLVNREVVELCTRISKAGQPLRLTSSADGSAEQVTSWLGVPLRVRQETQGALLLKSTPGAMPFSEKDQELLQFVSTQVATAIERQQMLARLQRMALYDPLTGLPNRELFHDRIQLALVRAQREKGLLALLYVDLDKFKTVNDTLGHAAGDQLLERIGRRLTRAVRASDTTARFGGDEFVILLENVDCADSAVDIARGILAELNRPFTLAGNHQVTIVPSIGLAMSPAHGEDEKALLRKADEAMYRAKNAGGNRIEVAGEDWQRRGGEQEQVSG